MENSDEQLQSKSDKDRLEQECEALGSEIKQAESMLRQEYWQRRQSESEIYSESRVRIFGGLTKVLSAGHQRRTRSVILHDLRRVPPIDVDGIMEASHWLFNTE